MRLIIFLLLLSLAALQYKLWMGEESLPRWINIKQQKTTQIINNKQLTARNKALQADITELKSNDQALEEQARYDLGMIKNGESYYQFIE